MDEFIDKLADLMNTYPPLWMIYGFVLVLPFVLMACCFIKPKSKDDDARRKKTDEPSPDSNPSVKKEPKKADGATVGSNQIPAEKIAAPTSSASPPKTSESQESGEIRQRSGGRDNRHSGKEKAQSKHTVLVTETPSKPSASVVVDSEECTIEEEVIGSVVVVSKAENTQVSVRDTEEEADEKQTHTTTQLIQQAVKEAEVAETSGSSEAKASGSVQPAVSEVEKVKEEEPVSGKKPSFPPTLDDFDLIECEADPAEVEEYLADPRLKEISLTLSDEEQLGLIIVGGVDSPNGSLPIYIKKVVPGGVASKDDRLSEGDQLLAVNDKILLECSNNYAVEVMRKAKGKTRLLVIQDY